MWNNMSQQISEDFGSFQGEVYYERSPEDFNPRLNEEVDEQSWHSHSLLSRPSFVAGDGSPQTCIRVVASKRRWKNAYGEGECVVVDSYAASSWGQRDYVDMAATPFNRERVALIKPEVVVEEAVETVATETKRVRIQVTMRESGKYVAGRNGNFMLQDVSGCQVTELLKPLEIQWPKCVKPERSVRVQIQDLIGGKYIGGGNYQLHNADVVEVCEMIKDLVVVEKPIEKVVVITEVWEKWKTVTVQCLDCGCGEKGSCLCRILAEVR